MHVRVCSQVRCPLASPVPATVSDLCLADACLINASRESCEVSGGAEAMATTAESDFSNEHANPVGSPAVEVPGYGPVCEGAIR